MFELYLNNIWVEDPKGDLWVISGRLPNQDDDSVLAVQTADEAMARGVFRAYMMMGRSKAIQEFDRGHFGTDLFICTVMKVATYKPITEG